MLAVNQTIMMALSMVVIASLIGGAGLGDTIISSLTYLDVGSATIGGAAIVFLAIALDRATGRGGRARRPRDASRDARGAAAPLRHPDAADGGSSWSSVSTLIARAARGRCVPERAQRARRSRQLDQQRRRLGREPVAPDLSRDVELRRLPRDLAARAAALVHGRNARGGS